MYKNQLQELAQRSCFNLPSYSCVREGPDHAPRFKVTVNFNGETFESPTFCSTLRQGEHAAAEVALNTLANRGPSRALAARVLDETGIYKNLLQETAHRAGLNLPIYTTVRSGSGHLPVFMCTVDLAGLTFQGEPAKTKKQAQKNAAMAAWSTLKQWALRDSSSSASPSPPSDSDGCEEQEQVVIARFLGSIQPTEAKNSPRQHQDGPTNSIHSFPIRAGPALYPMQYETLAYSGFPYRLWQQAQSSHLQSHRLLTLPVSPPPMTTTPRVLPVMPPFLQPDHIYYTVRSGPPDYFSGHPVPAPTRVKIQEINDERTGGSRSEVLSAPVITGYNTNEEAIQGKIEENDKKKSGMSEPKLGVSGQQEKSQPYNSKWVPTKNTQSGCSPLETRACESSQSNPRASETPLYMASPVRIRNAGPSLSPVGVRPQNLTNRVPAPGKMKTGVLPSSYRPAGFVMPSRFMAPAVQIRSVVPVCSAPPTKKVPTSVQEGNSSSQIGNVEQENTPAAAAASELGKLHI